jgi:hypothetical protein
MAGTSTNPMQFSPEMMLTRGMAVTVLYRYAGSQNNNSQFSTLNSPFTDIADTAWYRDAVLWAVANGIVSGYGEGRFGPDDNVTREQLAAILNNYANFSGMNFRETRKIVIFDDSGDIAAYAKDAVDKFYRAGIISGQPGNKFVPQGSATRAEFASMLHRFLTL